MSLAAGSIIERPTSAPPPKDGHLGSVRSSDLLTVPVSISAANSTVSSPVIPTRSTPTATASRVKGMQLGANKVPVGATSAALVAQLAEEVAAEGNDDVNPWGSDDLMDVNADQDDWSKYRGYLVTQKQLLMCSHAGAFESAPAPVAQPKPVSAVGVGFEGLQNGRTSSHLCKIVLSLALL